MSTRLSYKELGFWRSLSRMSAGSLFGAWDFWSAALLSAVTSFIYVKFEPAASIHAEVAGDFLQISGALLGVVIAGFAIVASLLGERYSRLLRQIGKTSLHVLGHFMVVTGLLVVSIVSTIVYRAGSEVLFQVKPGVEQTALGVVFFIFLWSLFASLQLAKLILGLAVTNIELHPTEH